MADDSSDTDSRPSADGSLKASRGKSRRESNESRPGARRGSVYDWRPMWSTVPPPWSDDEIEAIRAAVGLPLSDDGRRKLAEGLRLPVCILSNGLISDGKPSPAVMRDHWSDIEKTTEQLLQLLTGKPEPFWGLLPVLDFVRDDAFAGRHFNIEMLLYQLSLLKFYALPEVRRQNRKIKKIGRNQHRGRPSDYVILGRLADVFEDSFEVTNATCTKGGPFFRFASVVLAKAGCGDRTDAALLKAIRKALKDKEQRTIVSLKTPYPAPFTDNEL